MACMWLHSSGLAASDAIEYVLIVDDLMKGSLNWRPWHYSFNMNALLSLYSMKKPILKYSMLKFEALPKFKCIFENSHAWLEGPLMFNS